MMSDSSSLDHRSTFDHDGYLVVENLLNWQNDILPLVFEYEKLIDALAEIFPVATCLRQLIKTIQ